jgi:hypothetical protein
MVRLLALPAGYAAIAAGATPPTFAPDFYSGTQTDLAINQGGYDKGKGISCCSVDAPSCKVQTQSTGGDLYEQGSMNRTREDSPQGGMVVTWGAPVYKQIFLAPGSSANSSHAFVCAQYCDHKNDFLSSVAIGDGKKGLFDTPKDIGPAPQVKQDGPGGETADCEHWRWTETILKLIPMQKTDFYVNTENASNPLPWYSQQVIEPLGKAIGGLNESFLQFTPGDMSAQFDIDMDSVAACKLGQSCNGQPPTPGPPALRRLLAREQFKPSMLELAKLQAAEAPDQVDAAAAVSLEDSPTFIKDFTYEETGQMIINQGGLPEDAQGGVCCDASSPQCQVQVSGLDGTRYWDVTNNRTRLDDHLQGVTLVDDYNTQKTLNVNYTTGECMYTCPLEEETLEGFSIDPAAKDIGASTIGNLTVEGYEYSDVILKVIKMQTTDMYVDQTTDPTAAVPVFSHTVLTPFGRTPAIGSQNQTFSNLVRGTPDPSKFDIKGADTCPDGAEQCQQQTLQLHRLMSRNYHTFWKYVKAVAEE